jgi:Sap, sulfolipid-1-addressing protein
MGELLAEVVPLALGAAIAPSILTLELLALGTDVTPLRRGWAMALGYLVGLVAWAVVALALTRGVGGSDAEPEWTAFVRLAAAGALAVAGVVTLARGPSDKVTRQLSPPKPDLAAFVGVGAAVMLTNLTTLALFIPAVHLIGVSGVAIEGRALTLAIVLVITMIPSFAPPLAVSIVGASAQRVLAALNAWLLRHSRAIGAVVCFGFAILLAVQGVEQLS